jgi:hypothetical protein
MNSIELASMTIGQLNALQKFICGVFKFVRISHTSIGQLSATQKFHLLILHSKWTKNNTLKLPPKKSTHKSLLWMSHKKNIKRVKAWLGYPKRLSCYLFIKPPPLNMLFRVVTTSMCPSQRDICI